MATINFATQEFRKAHGFLPRGKALWVFYFADAPLKSWSCSEQPVTYMEAKSLAVIEARRRGVAGVRVDPYPLHLKLYDEGT